MKEKLLIFILLAMIPGGISAQKKNIKNQTFKFVSFPDFFNFDIPEPWPPYDEAVNYFLDQVKSENPRFALICGDLVNGHWWDSPQCVEHMGAIYYSGWKRRMAQHNLKYYTAVGDHELGDDPWPAEKRKLVPHFERVYAQYLQMPANGPESKKGLAYYVREGDLLIVTVSPFDVVEDSMRIQVAGEQLEWFNKVMDNHRDAKFKIVQCHVGIWGNIKARSSSSIMLENGRESMFYKAMKQHGVDAVFTGEFHDVTVLESDGIWQIVHGSSWGRKIVNTQDYIVGEINGNTLTLTMKQIFMDAQGDAMWNLNKKPGPQEKVSINERTLKNGPEITGTLVIENNGGAKKVIRKDGVFAVE
ncbi:MAG: metallophosphoesterase [Breznakibacter sp.]